MTTRRQLEQAVIDAARQLVRVQWKTYLGYNYERRLIEAVQDLDALGPVSKPRSARCAPPTSEAAARWFSEHHRAVIAEVFRYICNVSGATTDEVIQALDRPHQTVSARVNELVNAGWLRDSGRTRPTRSGRDAVVWLPTTAALEAVRNKGIRDVVPTL